MDIAIRVAEVVEQSRWAGIVRLETSAGEVLVGVGVPEDRTGTAEAVGSDRGLLDVWPGADSLEGWAPASVRAAEQAAALLEACRDAAIRAWQERDAETEEPFAELDLGGPLAPRVRYVEGGAERADELADAAGYGVDWSSQVETSSTWEGERVYAAPLVEWDPA